MLRQIDLSTTYQTIVYLFVRNGQMEGLRPLYGYLEEGITPYQGWCLKKP